MTFSLRGNRKGIALLLTLLLALLVVSLAIGVLLMMSSTTLVTRYHISEAAMSNAAAGGLEEARDILNGTPNMLAGVAGHDTLDFNQPVLDAAGVPIPGLTRSTYAGLTGRATGQAGLYATVLSVVRNTVGTTVVRRADLRQESFAQYSRFFNTWSGPGWYNTSIMFGPVHSNQGMSIGSGSPGATFERRVTTVGSISNQSNGHFDGGVQTGVALVPFPTAASINNLQSVAASSGMVITGYSSLGADDPDVRIEFVTIDLNGDGDTSDENEGYFRVFRVNGTGQDRRNYVNARRWNNSSGSWSGVTTSDDPNIRSPNCGGRIDSIPFINAYAYVDSNGANNTTRTKVRDALKGDYRRCYLGGDRRLFGNQWVVSTPWANFDPWPGWGGSPPSALVGAIAAQGVDPSTSAGAVAETFWPLSQTQNGNFRGVIYVTGSVAVSGRVRGRVTLAARGNIVLADDILYNTPPNTTCVDILGLVTTNSVVIADNNMNTPYRVDGDWTISNDDTADEFFHAFIFTQQSLVGDDLFGDPSPQSPERCNSDALASRGCRILVGGLTEQSPGQIWNGTTGWHDEDHYDQCGSINPPPYYPTTGRFSLYRYYEVDPVGFNPVAWFAANQ